jgi:hypothetical protein
VFLLKTEVAQLNDLVDARLMPSTGYWSNFRRPSYLFEIEWLVAGREFNT